MNCLLCEIPMDQDDGQGWLTKFECQRCKMTLELMHQDLMSGTNVKESYFWFDPNKEKIVSYDRTVDNEIINIKDFT